MIEVAQDPAGPLIALGIIYLLSLVGDWVGRHTPVPRVALLLTAGYVLGPQAFGVISEAAREWFPLVADIALVMVGFLVGGMLTRDALRAHGRAVLLGSAMVTVCTFLAVFLGLTVAGVSIAACLVLAAVATATDPAATLDTIRSSGSRGPFSTTLTGIVALDDAWGLVAFSMALAVADHLVGQNGFGHAIADGARDILGGVLLGAVVGIPMAYLTGRIHKGEPTQSEALGMVLLCGGLALWLEVSFLLAAMVMGLVVTNLAKHHRRPFHAIEGIEWPFLVVFFVLAGASLSLDEVADGGWLLAGYIVLRLLGRVVGGAVGGRLGRMPTRQSGWLGLTLLPQAGVALGMTIVGVQRFPEIAGTVLPVVLAATVVFEMVGPFLTRAGLVAVGEASSGKGGPN